MEGSDGTAKTIWKAWERETEIATADQQPAERAGTGLTKRPLISTAFAATRRAEWPHTIGQL
jgi:hypothetical protein